jgi:hypothetical protein
LITDPVSHGASELHLGESGWGGVAKRFAHNGLGDFRAGADGEFLEIGPTDQLIAKTSLYFPRGVEESRQLCRRLVLDGRLQLL